MLLAASLIAAASCLGGSGSGNGVGGDVRSSRNPNGDQGESSDEGCVGAEGCACYPNSTCDGELTCASNLCVMVGESGGSGGRAAGSGSGAPAGGAGPAGGSGSSGSGEAGGGAGGDAGAAGSAPIPTGGCADGGRANVMGSLRTEVADIVFDTVTVEIHHKRDVDAAEDGCLRQLVFHLRAGEGCSFDVEAAEELDVDGRMKIINAQLSADSQCPMFPDESEGSYLVVAPLRSGAVRMEYADIGEYNVEEACISNTFHIEPSGSLSEVATGRLLNIAEGSRLTISGSFLSTALDGRCPVRDVPPEPPTGGSGASGAGGAGGTGGGAGGTGAGAGASGAGGTGGTGYTCTTTSLSGSGTSDSCFCMDCGTPGCGQGRCEGFTCCGRSEASGVCDCVNPSALGLQSCGDVVTYLQTINVSLVEVPSCP